MGLFSQHAYAAPCLKQKTNTTTLRSVQAKSTMLIIAFDLFSLVEYKQQYLNLIKALGCNISPLASVILVFLYTQASSPALLITLNTYKGGKIPTEKKRYWAQKSCPRFTVHEESGFSLSNWIAMMRSIRHIMLAKKWPRKQVSSTYQEYLKCGQLCGYMQRSQGSTFSASLCCLSMARQLSGFRWAWIFEEISLVGSAVERRWYVSRGFRETWLLQDMFLIVYIQFHV
ncbi:hypothetical protein FGO68_gene13576 [Halteria grandinella]|uniref:Uncharacterized protein n=1 Tax=Halteria grandinella TaxID=5974 RepID=A0A8J8T0H1_HALGN|nr:hypothetical protein FGO68_gene13576 [Halteria grandinella]